MQHSFDIEIAKEYGVLEAILLNNLWFWVEKNRANNVNYYDGHYWTFNSTKAFNELFPYASQRQIQSALKHLRDEGILQTSNYNKSTLDRTLWYSFTQKGETILLKGEMDFTKRVNPFYQKGKSILPKGEMDFTERVNPFYQKGKAIPYINTDINTDNNIYSPVSENLDENSYQNIIEYLNFKAGTNYKISSKKTRDLIRARISESFTIEDFKKVIDNKCEEWLKNNKMKVYLRPETLFGNKFESYLNQNISSKNDTGESILRNFDKNNKISNLTEEEQQELDDLLSDF